MGRKIEELEERELCVHIGKSSDIRTVLAFQSLQHQDEEPEHQPERKNIIIIHWAKTL